MKQLLVLVCAFVLLSCSDDVTSPNDAVPSQAYRDSVAIVHPPTGAYQKSIAGAWRCVRFTDGQKWCATYVLSGASMSIAAFSYDPWSPAMDLRIDGQRVWFEAYPLPRPGDYGTFNGTMVADSIVGHMMVWEKGSGGEMLQVGDTLWPMTWKRE